MYCIDLRNRLVGVLLEANCFMWLFRYCHLLSAMLCFHSVNERSAFAFLTFIADDDECSFYRDSNCTLPECTNTKGSYLCGCDVGFEHNTSDPSGSFYCVGKL